MSLQRRFEGPDVRALLDEICALYGPEPTIARAETFRTGGMLGFFAREHYRLIVDDGCEPVARAAVAGAAVAGAAVAGAAVEAPATAVTPIDPFAFLADATLDDTVVAAAPAPAAQGAGEASPTFETVLQGVARLVEAPTASAVTWPAADVPTDESLGLYRPPTVGTPADLTVLLSAAAAAAAAPEPAPTGGRDTSGESSDAFGALFAPEMTTRLPEPTPAPEPAPAPTPAPAPAARPVAVLRFRTAEPAPAEPAAIPPAPAQVQPPTPAEARAATAATAPGRDPMAERLLALGLHPDDVAGVERSRAAGYPIEAALLEVMDSYPAAPRLPRRPGSLVVVIGPGRRASAEAARIAGEVGTDPAGVAFATERRPVRPTPEELLIHGRDDALEMAPGHRRGRVGVVAVDASVGTPATWARHVVDALRPTQVVAVVDALHKSEDIADWIESVGGVDTLVVDNVAATVSPARILELGLPVSRLGDSPSTPARWVAALSDRLHAGADAPPADAAPDGSGLDGRRPSPLTHLELAGIAAAGDRRWA